MYKRQSTALATQPGAAQTTLSGARPDTTLLTDPGRHAANPEARDALQLGIADTPLPTWQQAQAAALTDRAAATTDLRATEPAAPGDRSITAPALTGLSSHADPSAKAGEAATVNLATPTTSAEFRSALGVQVSLLARSGVQQAELHLNPAEMGPVSIQIVLDGQQAQVNFGADSAQTRQLIESGMPELATALREAGLTLTGGGVSQHGGGQRHDGSPNAARDGNVTSGTAADETSRQQVEQVRRSTARSALGGVDLYA